MNGRVISDRYELGSVLGQGGMGQVWTGYDRRLDRRVAVKLMHPGTFVNATEADNLRRRFARECRVTAHVSHPGLVTVHDAGSDGDELYLVMEYVEGADLADHLAENDPYPLSWAVAVAAQLATVLTAVHAVPIIHRDLKPRNVIVRPDGTVVVLDLGVAFVMDSDTTGLTRTGSPLGSPAYMAPEQAMGNVVDTRTDLYALGVVLHELVGGRAPFAGGTALGVMHRHLYEPPVPLRQIRPEVPEELESLVLRLLAKEPGERPQDAHEAFGELIGLLRVLPSVAATGPMNPTRPFLSPQAPWPGRPTRSARPAPGTAPVAARASVSPAPSRSAAATPPPAVSGASGAPLRSVPEARAGGPSSPSGPAAGSAGSAAGSAAGSSAGPAGVVEAVDEARRLLEQGRIPQAVQVLGDLLPVAAREHGEQSAVVHLLRRQYAATLMEDRQYLRAQAEWTRLADEREAAAGPSDPDVRAYRSEAAQCVVRLVGAAAHPLP